MTAPAKREPLAFLPVSSDGPQTMSSREIAELCQKRHDHVLRDVRQMLAQLYGDEAVEAGLPDRDKFEAFFDKMGWGIDSPNLGNGRVEGVKVRRDARGFVAEINLDYTHTMTLVAGYKVKLRKAIIDKWQELERSAQKPNIDLNNPAHLRLLLADYANDKMEMQAQIADLAPKADALDRIATAEGSLCITDAAKTLQVQPKVLFAFLRSHRWIYGRLGAAGDVAYQDKLASGLLEHKTTTVHRSDGSEKVVTQCRVTTKGLARLAKELEPAVRAA